MSHEKSPFLSVIIPTYNREYSIRYTIDSLVKQTYKNFEVLICDDGSTDHTKNTVSNYQKELDIKYFWCENFGGPAKARNIGVLNASGQFICFLDSDDTWSPNKLEVMVDYLHKDLADIYYHDMWLIKSRDQRFFWKKLYGRKLSPPVFNDLVENGNALINSSVTIKADILKESGGFSEDKSLIAFEDFECWLRVARLTSRFKYIPKPLGYYWIGGNNISEPRRSITACKRLIQLYREIQREQPEWLYYKMARSLYQTNKKQDALVFIKKLKRDSLPLMIRFKVLWMSLNIFINQKAAPEWKKILKKLFLK